MRFIHRSGHWVTVQGRRAAAGEARARAAAWRLADLSVFLPPAAATTHLRGAASGGRTRHLE